MMPCPCFSSREDMRTICRVSVLSLTFIIISSVFPWTTASGLMIANVQDFSDETAMSRGWCCQTLGSREAIRRDHAASQSSLSWPLICAPADLDSSRRVSQTFNLNLNLAGRARSMQGTETGKEGVGEGRGKRSKTTQEQKPRNPESISLWVGEGRGELEQRQCRTGHSCPFLSPSHNF